jgi:hypothetical protein
MEKKEQNIEKETRNDRTAGTGAKASVSRSGNVNENEDAVDSPEIDETQKNKLDEQDAGTGLDTDRKQRRG